MLPPMVERELQVALRRRKARQQWLVAAWMAAGVCLFFLLILGLSSTRSMGRTLFRGLFALGCAGVVSRGFGLTADLFSEERRNGTLGLLVLTGLRPLEIFLNKLLGAVMLAAYGLLGAVPFFAIPFLTGGIPSGQFFSALVFLANGLLFCVAVGLLASVLHRDGGQAQATALAITALLSLATPVTYWVSRAASGLKPLNPEWLTLSPAYAPALIFGRFTGASSRLFWSASGFTLCYSLAALLLAAWVLQRTWRDGPETLAPQGWRARWNQWARGGHRWQRRLRARLLSDQPFCWLAARDRRPVVFAQAFLIIAVAAWVGAWRIRSSVWLSPGYAVASSIIVHLGLNWILAYAVGRRFAEERQSGGFEILLTTPVGSAAIVEGQCRAFLVQFRGVLLVVFALDGLFCFASCITLATWSLLAVAVYLIAWGVLGAYWFGMHLEAASRAMWISAWTGRPGYAAIQAMRTKGWVFLWIWFMSRATVFPARGRPIGLAVVLLLFLWFAAVATFASRRMLLQKLIKELALIACAPIPARGDKRFKSWNPEQIFPPGRWGELQLIPGAPRKSHRRHRRLFPSHGRKERA